MGSDAFNFIGWLDYLRWFPPLMARNGLASEGRHLMESNPDATSPKKAKPIWQATLRLMD